MKDFNVLNDFLALTTGHILTSHKEFFFFWYFNLFPCFPENAALNRVLFVCPVVTLESVRGSQADVIQSSVT